MALVQNERESLNCVEENDRKTGKMRVGGSWRIKIKYP